MPENTRRHFIYDDPDMVTNWQKLRETFPYLSEQFGPKAIREQQILMEAKQKAEKMLADGNRSAASIRAAQTQMLLAQATILKLQVFGE